MAFTNYTIVPEDNVTVIDGVAALGVDMTGIAPDVHAIQWYGLRNSGTIEYKADPLTGELPTPGTFTDPNTYATQVTEAEAIIQAANNPAVYYSTVSGLIFQGVEYPLGASIVIYTPNPVQPANTTTEIPPTPEDFQQLYWYNDAWVVSSVDPSFSVSEAKNTLNDAVETSAASQGALQARIYSPLQLATSVDPGALPTADYSGMDLSEYQTYLDGQVATQQATVNAATTTSELYDFNPAVDGNPNP